MPEDVTRCTATWLTPLFQVPLDLEVFQWYAEIEYFYFMHHISLWSKKYYLRCDFFPRNLYRTGWSVFSASEIGFECEFCIKRNACQSFCFSKSLSANCNIMLLNASDKNGFFHHQWKILYSFTGIFHFSFLPSFWAILHHVTVGSLRSGSWIRANSHTFCNILRISEY